MLGSRRRLVACSMAWSAKSSIHIHIYIYTHTHIHFSVYIHMYIYIYTHTPTHVIRHRYSWSVWPTHIINDRSKDSPLLVGDAGEGSGVNHKQRKSQTLNF